MEDLANEFSCAMIKDIGSAPCGLMQKSTFEKSSLECNEESSSNTNSKNSSKNNYSYKSKISYSVNLDSNQNKSSPNNQSNKNCSKSKQKNSTRSSSILLKSSSLVLSDSDTLSEELKESSFFSEKKQRIKKPKRKKADKDAQAFSYIPINDSDQYFGKRKRSTTISQNSFDSNNYGKGKKNEENSMHCDYSKLNDSSKIFQIDNKMDCDDLHEVNSSLSEDSNLSDPRFEADDEQSDFCDSSTINSHLQKKREKIRKKQYGDTNNEKNYSSSNPFSMLSSTSPSTSSSVLWKKRKKNLEHKFFPN